MNKLFDVPLMPDEPLTSYVSRLARANGTTSMRAFCHDLGLDRSSLVRGDDREIVKLRQLVSMPLANLRSRALVRESGNSSVVIGDSEFSKLSRSRLRVCPHCIADDDSDEQRMPGTRRYARLYWVFPYVMTCPRHSKLIVGIDTSGAMQHRYDLNTQLECTADQLLKAIQESPSRDITAFELYVIDRLSGVKCHGDFLDGMNLASGIAACELFGISLIYGHEAGRSGKSEDELCKARNLAFETLLKGYDGFREILRRVRVDGPAACNRSGPQLYGNFYKSLSYSYRASQFDFLRNEIREETLREVPILNGADFFGPVTDSRWTSVRRLALQTGYSKQTVRKVLKEVGHSVSLHPSVNFISLDIAEHAIKALNEVVSQSEAARMLGTTPNIVRTLTAAGFLPDPVRSDTSVDQKYSMSATVELRTRIDSLTCKCGGDDWVTVGRAASRLGVTAAEVLKMMFDGKLTNIARVSEAVGLGALRIDPIKVPTVRSRSQNE